MSAPFLLIPVCVLTAGAVLSSCASRRGSEEGEKSAGALPGAYSRASGEGKKNAPGAGWWKRFGSRELDSLIEEARANSFDVAASLARVEQARARTRIASAALLPEVSASAGVDQAGRSGSGETGYASGLSAGYEVDLWGRLRAVRRGAGHQLRSDVYDHEATLLILTRDVAAAWLSAVALRERVTLAESSLATARNLLTFIESRARAGSASPLELAQQRGLTAGREDAVAELKAESARSELALGLLLGRAGSVSVGASSLDRVKLPSWRADIPSELLTRRPDIARAEADLAAAEADVDAARAALLPRLTFRVGVESSGSGSASFFSRPFQELAAGLTAPIFQGGRLRAEADETRARRQELLVDYHKTIATAFSDVERALVALHETETRRAPQEARLSEARRALDLSDSRYRAGAETLLTLLNAQESLNEAQAARTAWRLSQFQAALSLVSALGGGWEK